MVNKSIILQFVDHAGNQAPSVETACTGDERQASASEEGFDHE